MRTHLPDIRGKEPKDEPSARRGRKRSEAGNAVRDLLGRRAPQPPVLLLLADHAARRAGYSLEEFRRGTPLGVGSPQEVIEKTLTFREGFGDYQRRLRLVDHAGLPLEMALP